VELVEIAGFFAGLALVAAVPLALLLRSAEALAARRKDRHLSG
jgi:hypothetical protein